MVLAAGMLLVAIAFAALARNSAAMLLGTPSDAAPSIAVPATVRAALLVGIGASVVLGITAGPLTDLLGTAASQLGAVP